MKKILTQFAISTASFAVALLLFWGVAVVLGAWNEPSQAPPVGNVAAPITVGSANQNKVGTISAKDVWSEDADVWMSEIMKLKLFSLMPFSTTVNDLGWPNGFTVLSNPQPGTGVASLPWTVNGKSIIPTGATASRVKALLVRGRCKLSSFFASDNTHPIPPYPAVDLPRRVCSTDGGTDDMDTNDFIVPIYTSGNDASFKFDYRYDRYTHGNEQGTFSAIVIGLYYQ